MSAKLSIILLEDVEGLGHAGEIVTVAEGFARNQLFPDGKAALAESSSGKQAKRKQAQKDEVKKEEMAAAQSMAEKLEGTELTMKAKLKEGNEIFGSITAKHIAEELSQQLKKSFAAKDVKLPEPIRTLGSSEITVVITPGVECQMYVNVIQDEEA